MHHVLTAQLESFNCILQLLPPLLVIEEIDGLYYSFHYVEDIFILKRLLNHCEGLLLDLTCKSSQMLFCLLGFNLNYVAISPNNITTHFW